MLNWHERSHNHAYIVLILKSSPTFHNSICKTHLSSATALEVNQRNTGTRRQICLKRPVPILIYFILCWCLLLFPLNLSWRRFLSYKNEFNDLLCKSIDSILYDRDLRNERVDEKHYNINYCCTGVRFGTCKQLCLHFCSNVMELTFKSCDLQYQ